MDIEEVASSSPEKIITTKVDMGNEISNYSYLLYPLLESGSFFGIFGQINSLPIAIKSITPMFLHFGELHLVFNMVWLWYFGKQLEEVHSAWFFILIIVGILVLDQFLKLYIKLNFPLTIYSDQIIFDYNWFKLLFVENKGMAWGASINDFLPFIDERSAKLILTLFRIVAIGFIFFWLKESIKSGLKNINSIVLLKYWIK